MTATAVPAAPSRELHARIPTIRLINVTPEMAAEWLTRMAPNRRLSPVQVNKYVRDILEGNWKTNAETIKLDVNGFLIDGQHRANAIVIAGIAVQMFVAFGLDPAAADTVDTGRARSFHDVLTRRGAQSPIGLAAAAGWLYRHEKGLVAKLEHIAVSHSELDDILSRHPGLYDSMQRASQGGRVIPAPSLAFVHYVARGQNAAMADEFAYMAQHGTAMDGSGLHSDHPVFRLRERLIFNRSAKAKMHRLEVLALVIKAWTMFRDGERPKTLRWRSRGDSPERFPTFD